ncbi:hypothetical protein [Streptomyces sp. NPDC093149]|uniref:hypothetical protein n=1 Tax=Streptomyces sp. NPDC093149 TaxID=3366031 RepID=UPI0038003BCE
MRARFVDHYGTIGEAERGLSRSTAHGWPLYPVPLSQPAGDHRTYDVEITPNCAYSGP